MNRRADYYHLYCHFVAASLIRKKSPIPKKYPTFTLNDKLIIITYIIISLLHLSLEKISNSHEIPHLYIKWQVDYYHLYFHFVFTSLVRIFLHFPRNTPPWHRNRHVDYYNFCCNFLATCLIKRKNPLPGKYFTFT